MRIVFFGTPVFAQAMLTSLVEGGHEVVCAVTQPDKPVGRKRILTPPPVKVYAEANGIPVLQPEKLRGNAEFEEAYRALAPDLAVVASYGKIVPAYVLDTPVHGALNVHGSLLPAYRGAAPIQRAIMDGQSVTGITIMQMDEGLDTGDMLLKESVAIEENDTYETLHDKLAEIGGPLLLRAISELSSLTPEKQDGEASNYAKKIEEADCLLDFTKSAREVHNHVRGLSPQPTAFAFLNGKKVKLVRTALAAGSGRAGEVIAADKKIVIACGEGAVELLELIPEGKNKMGAGDFVRGRNVSIGDVFMQERS
ncbi:MAG: methionyl-tRNA formyltransferase [Ruminococcaceae bacterium]|nr:methionyl-tRNA formyltransferase [Oscillospiraceae bacterium]